MSKPSKKKDITSKSHLMDVDNEEKSKISSKLKPTKLSQRDELSTPTKESQTDSAASQIIDIWAKNLNEAISKIEDIIDKYPYIAVDTEFPGVVARPVDSFRHWLGYCYRTVADNVNMLKIIQLGLTFYNEKGETPKPFSTYQFNFKFNMRSDMFAPDSIQLLMQSGIDFDRLNTHGIKHNKFAELITMSGLVLNENVRWVCFHGSYDFAYLIKTLRSRNLPLKESEFFFYLEKYFPVIYDLKVLLRNVHCIKGGGLQKLANTLNVKRIGNTHMAGSDSLLTGNVFFKLRELYFEELMDQNKYLNTLYGLGNASFVQQHNQWYFH
eukprot:179465_1